MAPLLPHKYLTMTNTLAYSDTAIITGRKSFNVQAPGVEVSMLQ